MIQIIYQVMNLAHMKILQNDPSDVVYSDNDTTNYSDTINA